MQKHPVITESRIKQALSKIEALIHPESRPVEIGIWEVRGEPVAFSVAKSSVFTSCNIGHPWGGQWDTAWFHMRGVVPADWKGKHVVARMRVSSSGREGFTAEGLVYDKGRVKIAINANRREILIAQNARGGEAFEFYIEAAANGGVNEAGMTTGMLQPDYEGEPLFRLEQADLSYVDPLAFAFYYDFKVALEAMEVSPENSQRRGELRYALNECLNRLDWEDRSTVHAAAETLRYVLDRKNGVGGHEISAVGHAHIDTAWLWPLRETIRKCARTFSTALDYMGRYPEYVFVCSQAQQYAWMKQYYPEIWEGIKKAVQRGQWEPVGSMWVEVDCNLASGESLVRQILYGKKFFKEELDYETKDVWIPDVFGYAASLPQIMRKAGVEYFLTQKISWNQFNKFPHHTFEWEGIDGTRIFTHFPPADTYNADTGPRELVQSQERFREHDRAKHSLLIYGWGDGGGGPSVEMLEKARRVQDMEGVPKLTSEKALTFFEKAQAGAKDLPVWVGELYLEYHRGTYTSQAKNKLGNRRAELLLRDAEFLDAVSSVLVPEREENAADPDRAVYDVTGMEGDKAQSHKAALERAWKLVLLNQFHDIIPGTSINWVYEDSTRDYVAAHEMARSVTKSSLQSLYSRVDTAGFGQPVVVANTLGHSRREVITLPGSGLSIVEVGPCGYAVVEAGGSLEPAHPVTVETDKEGIRIQNGLISLTIGSDGNISSIRDVRAGREVCSGPANLFQLHEDIPVNWDAWDVDIFYKEKCREVGGLCSLEITGSDPLRCSAKLVRSFGRSRIVQTIVLHADSTRIDFQTEVDWQESQKFLKVSFPLNVRAMSARYEVQYGNVERPTHSNTSWDMARFEVCAQKWADLSEQGYGVALLNDCKYGYDVSGNVLRLSLLKAAIYPDPMADRGVHFFTYALLPHVGSWVEGGVKEHADALNSSLLVSPIEVQAGELPSKQCFFSVDRSGLIIEAVKVAESGKDVIVRLYEAFGGRGTYTIRTSLPAKAAYLVNLLEEDRSAAPLVDGGISLEVSPFQIITLRYVF